MAQDQIKTVLVPGAPWPPKDAKVKGGGHHKGSKKRKQTDVNFEDWVKKQKAKLTRAKYANNPFTGLVDRPSVSRGVKKNVKT